MGCCAKLGKFPSPKNTQQWQVGNSVPCPLWSKSSTKDGGAEQGDVDGPSECSLALEMEAAEARLRVHELQAARTLPWIGAHDTADAERLQDEQHSSHDRSSPT